MKQYFEDIIDNIIGSEAEQKEFASNNLQQYPKQLYKYRDGKNEYDFQMLEEQYLWADIPMNFRDPFDAIVNLKLKSELPAIQKWLYKHLGELLYYSIQPQGMQPHKQGQTLENYIEAQNRFMDTTGRFNAQKAKRIMLLETKKMHPKNRTILQKAYDKFESPEFEKTVQQAIEKSLENVVTGLRKKHMVCCLTERKDNQKMWEDYANAYSGFVIEYNLEKCIDYQECYPIITHLFPVSYYKRMPKVPLLPFIEKIFYKDLYGKDISTFDASKKLFKQLLIKKYDYLAEEEWRIISSEHKISFPFISAVYAGEKISLNNLDRLKEICGKYGYSLYKQRFSLNGEIKYDLISS